MLPFTRCLPDPDISMRDIADFILDSKLGRKAICCTEIPRLPIFLRDLISIIYRLTISCHLPEFTDHGLRHLCSMVDRISLWTFKSASDDITSLCDNFDDEGQQAAILLIAVLIHDIGMLSQRPEDLPKDNIKWPGKGNMDIPTWVRKTHVLRIRHLIKRLIINSIEEDYTDIYSSPLLNRAICVAEAHEKWPWENGFVNLIGQDIGLAAVLAVSDLLDEDASRCDSVTMIEHRQGTMLNYGHWIRHSLTTNRILITEGTVNITFVRPPDTDYQMAPVYAALRNHYRLIKLYIEPLSIIGAGFLDVSFLENSIPEIICPELENWYKIPGLTTQRALVYHLLNTFFPEAVIDKRKVSSTFLTKIHDIDLEEINLKLIYNIQGDFEIRSIYEQACYAIINE